MGWIDHRLAGYKDRIACCEAGRSWTYKEFLGQIGQFEGKIASMVASGVAVIAIQFKSEIISLAAFLAVARTKQIGVLLSSQAPKAVSLEQQRIAGAAFILDEGGLRTIRNANCKSALVEQLTKRGHAGWVLFSSGTSGKPKGMLHDLDLLLDRYKRIQPRSDRSLQLLPIDHIGGLDSALRTLFAGSTLVVPGARTAASVCSAIEQYSVNVLPASPTFLNLMLLAGVAGKFDCSSLEIIAYGAEPMPKKLLERLVMVFPRVHFQQKFGTSETGAIRIKSQDVESIYFRIEDADVQWRVHDGELWLKTSSQILGYLNAEETSLEADGWYRTGDLVEEADGGYLRIIGRRSELINVGGRKVHPSEVEEVIAEIEGVDACVVFGEPAAVTGSVVACKIVTVLDDNLRSWKRKIRAHCRGRLADWKIPAKIELGEELSITSRLKRRA